MKVYAHLECFLLKNSRDYPYIWKFIISRFKEAQIASNPHTSGLMRNHSNSTT